MIVSKRMILEQGGRWGQTAQKQRLKTQRTQGNTEEIGADQKAAFSGGFLKMHGHFPLIIFVAGALPVDQFADGGAGARYWLFVGFHFLARGFFAYGPDA